MNYSELREAIDLVEETRKINWMIKTIERKRHIHIQCFGYKVLLFGEQMEKVLEILKEIRDKQVKRLEELGVTEEE